MNLKKQIDKKTLFKKITRVISYLLLTVFLFVYIFLALLNTSVVQSITAAKLADYFSKEWKTEFRIGALSVNIFDGVGLYDVFLADRKGDTILLADKLSVKLLAFPSDKGIKLGTVRLEDAVFNLETGGGKGVNFKFILDYFKSNKPKKKKSPSPPFIIDVKRCKLKNVSFSLRLRGNKKIYPQRLVAINNMRYRDVNFDMRDILVISDSINVRIKNFSAKERSGLYIKNLSGSFTVSPKGIIAKDANIRTSNTDLYFDALMKTKSWKTYSHFVDSVYCKGEIKKGSFAGIKDATYWADVIRGFEQKVEISAKFYGKVSDIHCQDLEIKTGNETYIKAKGTITGLPKSEKTVYNLLAQEIRTSYSDYKSMRLGHLLENLPILNMVSKLGKISVKGEFKGLIKNFDASAIINTEIGNLNLIGSSIKNDDEVTYSANILSQQFDAGKLLNLPWLKTNSISAKAEVTGKNLNTLKARLTAGLGNINLKGINYDTIFVDGNMENKQISAQCYLNDDAVKLSASTEFLLGDKKSLYVDADIDYANINKLNLFKFSDTTTTFSGKIIADIQDLNPKTLAGNVNIQNLKFVLSDTNVFSIKHLNAQMTNNKMGNNLKIYSDIFDLSMVGNYSLDDVGSDVAWIVKQYIPKFNFVQYNEIRKDSSLVDVDYKNKSTFEFSATIKNPKPIFLLFAPNIQLSNNVAIYGKCNPEDKFSLNIDAKKLIIGNMVIDNLSLESKVKGEHLNTLINTSNFNISDSLYLKNIALEINSNSNELDFFLNFSDNLYDKSTRGRLNFKSMLTENSLQGGFENSELEIMGNKLSINNDNIISYDGKKIAILNFLINKPKESIAINGILSDKYNDELEINFKNVEISSFNSLIKNTGLELSGRINKEIKFRSLLNKPFFTSNLVIDSLTINNNLLGRTEMHVSNALANDELLVNIKALYKGSDGTQNSPLAITGFVYPQRKKDNLNLNVSLKNFNIKVIEKYLTSFASETEGLLSGNNIKIKGGFNQPDIRGLLVCKNGAMKIDMINTKYYFSDTIKVENNQFILNNFRLYDAQKNALKINGKITHHYFKDYDINLMVDADKIKILNTKASSGQMYYGEAYASARAKIEGDLSMLNIDVTAKTEKGTKLVIPVSSKTSVSKNSFIQFTQVNKINKEDSTLSLLKPKEKTSKGIGLNIMIKLAVTPNAIISLPMNFNQISGELSASGEGDIKLEINNKGQFDMFGKVDISSGTFEMSLMEIIDKTFQIEKGGSIQFNGKPTNAIIDVSAVYKTKASLAPILGVKYTKPVDVQSVIMLSGNMTNPLPKFDIKLPNTDAQTVDLLFMNIDKNDDKQMLEQTASLLLTRQFYSNTGGINNIVAGTDLTSSALELAFGQITGMLTNMVKFVDVGLNYTPGIQGITDQYDLRFSKDIGRWEIEGNAVFGGKTETQAQGASSFIGDINAEYKITENFRFKAFNKSNANDFTKYNITPYTQGIGITYKKEYDNFSDIFKSRKQRNKVLK